MSEKIYALLLKLYPEHFRRAYGDEAMRLVHDRARSEKGFFPGLRLWVDLLVDFAISLPREYSKGPTTAIVAKPVLNGEASFQLLAERSLNPALLFFGGTVSAVLLWACVISIAHMRTFPALFPNPLSLQGVVQSTLARARDSYEESRIQNSARNPAAASSVSVGAYSGCMTAKRDIPSNSVQPLFAFDFAPPGASGVALIDGKIVRRFKNEQRLSIRAHVFAGEHWFVLHLDRRAQTMFMSSNDDFESCPPQ